MAPRISERSTGVTSHDFSRLTSSIGRLEDQISRLTARLAGDEKLQSPGLIHEVADIRASIDRSQSDFNSALVDFRKALDAAVSAFKETSGKLDSRTKILEDDKSAQSSLIADLRFVRVLTDKFWKVACLFVAGGCINPLIYHFISKAFGR